VLISSKFKGARAGGPWTWFYDREDEATCTPKSSATMARSSTARSKSMEGRTKK
jgi:hypothetical protein